MRWVISRPPSTIQETFGLCLRELNLKIYHNAIAIHNDQCTGSPCTSRFCLFHQCIPDHDTSIYMFRPHGKVRYLAK